MEAAKLCKQDVSAAIPGAERIFPQGLCNKIFTALLSFFSHAFHQSPTRLSLTCREFDEVARAGEAA
ncbi:hypothetical protein [Pseudomonas fluorescens]|uniref:hypothetical protein n=1 Tax=Pseudomonas fluorescens TaxID=294 RepID=UPI0012404995|nr:hypothetical protein [Pseudomonas fluorescens]